MLKVPMRVNQVYLPINIFYTCYIVIDIDNALQMITALLLLISCTLDVLLAGLHLVAVHDQLLYCITARLQLHSIW